MTSLPLDWLVAAAVRVEVASFLGVLLQVYVYCVIAWVISQMLFAFGVRPPYSRVLNAILDFLRDVSEPFLRIFRRLPLQIGPIDLSPLVAIIVLQLVGGIIIRIIHG